MQTSSKIAPRRVVHLVGDLAKGGAEKQLYLLASQPSQGFLHSVLAVRAEGPWADALRGKGISVHCLGARRIASIPALVGSISYLRRTQPDIVHSWLPSLNLFASAVLVLARLRSTHLVVSVRNVDDWKSSLRRLAERFASGRWDSVICNSQAGTVQAARDGISPQLLHYVANGIPMPSRIWTRSEARRVLSLPSESLVVAIASRLVPQKRVSIVLDVASRLPAIRFVIAGDGPLSAELRQRAPANVRFLGHVTDAAPLFSAADVFLSVSEREGASNSLLEALQAGCAALLTDVGDNLSIAGNAGLAVSAETVTEELARLAVHPDELARLRSAAPSRARTYSVETMIAATEAVYSSVAPEPETLSKRVLFLDYTNGIGMGGGQHSLLLLLANLDRAHFQPLLACPSDERWRGEVPSDVRIFDLPLAARFRHLSRSSASWIGSALGLAVAMGSVWNIRRIIHRERIDVVHANNLKVALIASVASWGRSVPVVWHVRDIFPKTGVTRWARRVAATLATRVITVSGAVASQFNCATELVHNAVCLPQLESARAVRATFRRLHSIPDQAFLFGYVGRIDPGKGIDTLIRAFSSLAPRHPDIGLVIAGEGPCRLNLETLGRELSPKRIIWTGFVPTAEVLAALDCAVVPSVAPDSFPRAVIEAMSWALPVIGSASGGIAEAIIDGQTGSVVPIGDAESLCREMEKMVLNPSLARCRGTMGRQACEERFAVSQQMGRIEKLYREVLLEAH